jgi:hypothetical protein
MTLDNQNNKLQSTRLRTAWIFGALGGLAFSTISYGLDSFPLLLSHTVLPLLPWVASTIPCMAVGALAGWLTYRINHILASLFIWLATGMLFSYISSHLLFEIQTAALGWLAPDWASRVQYPFNSVARGHAVIVFLVVTTISCLAGLLSINSMDSAADAVAPAGRIFAVLTWVILFALAGLAPKNSYSETLLRPVAETNQLIQFAVDHQGQTVNPTLAAQIHLRSMEAIQDLLHQPRQLILAGFDDNMSNMRVLIRFSDTWVECSVVDNLVNFCEKK